jgi:hypothetical protein
MNKANRGQVQIYGQAQPWSGPNMNKEKTLDRSQMMPGSTVVRSKYEQGQVWTGPNQGPVQM